VKRTRRKTARLLAVFCIAGAGAVLAQGAQFRVRLSTVPISAAERATVTGHGQAMATLDGRRLTVSGTFSGLQGPATTAALHLGRATGVRGPAIHELNVSSSADGELSGTVSLSRSEVQALEDGRVYIQIHSEAATDGNLWGWLLE
jgi:hypothetical protein